MARHLVGEGLVTVMITGILYVWGRLFFENMVGVIGVPYDGFNPLTRDLLAAPLRTVLTAMLGSLIFFVGFGSVALYSAAGGRVLSNIARPLAHSRFKIVRNYFRRLEREASSQSSRNETPNRYAEADETVTQVFAQAIMLLILFILALWGGFSAGADGRELGLEVRDSCIRGSKGYWVVSAADTLNFCTRINEDVIWYSRRSNALRVEKWNGQSISVPLLLPHTESGRPASQ